MLSDHFRGELDRLTVPATGEPDGRDPVDLSAMAAAALNYLRGNPDPARRYECKFHLGPLGIPVHLPTIAPPNEYGYDPVSLGDTDCRMAMQYAHMRAMAGEGDADEVERGVQERCLGYLRDDHYAWINPAAYVGRPVEGEWIGSYTTAKTLYHLAEIWWRTGYPPARDQARSVLLALRDLARWDGDRAWYMGIAPYRDGQWLMDGWCQYHGRNYPFVVEPCVRYWECTGDEEGLALAVAFTEGFLAGSQPDMGTQRIDPESGAFTGHVHLHTHAAWGVAHLGAVLAEPRYLDWAQRAFDFVHSHGTDYGWYPEHYPQPERRSEVCAIGDMVSIAAWLARGGRARYWDQVDRAVRNELYRSQFRLSPSFLELFHRLHHDLPKAVLNEAIGELRKLEGGFVAQATLDDWVSYPSDHLGQAGMNANGIHMMGCCPPEGMRALYEAWSGTVTETADAVWVNLPFRHDHPAARVEACPAGRLTITAGKPADYLARPPAWVDRATVTLAVDEAERPVSWAGPEQAYVAIGRLQPGQVASLRHAVPEFRQRFEATSVPGREESVTVHWRGNEVRAVEPRGVYLPMFPPRD